MGTWRTTMGTWGREETPWGHGDVGTCGHCHCEHGHVGTPLSWPWGCGDMETPPLWAWGHVMDMGTWGHHRCGHGDNRAPIAMGIGTQGVGTGTWQGGTEEPQPQAWGDVGKGTQGPEQHGGPGGRGCWGAGSRGGGGGPGGAPHLYGAVGPSLLDAVSGPDVVPVLGQAVDQRQLRRRQLHVRQVQRRRLVPVGHRVPGGGTA